jgi:pimeloyl-ACP methyl ester carboxylesterase
MRHCENGGEDVNPIDDQLRHALRPANGIRLHVVESGPEDGTPVLSLHGFPEFWFGWQHRIGLLAYASFQVIAPGQQGDNTSNKHEPDAIDTALAKLLPSAPV